MKNNESNDTQTILQFRNMAYTDVKLKYNPKFEKHELIKSHKVGIMNTNIFLSLNGFFSDVESNATY